jgi:60 kDa SS-A/Ro ribonucleoprotein
MAALRAMTVGARVSVIASKAISNAVEGIDCEGNCLIVFTDEQSHDKAKAPRPRLSRQRRSLSTRGRQRPRTRVDGSSEAVIAWIAEPERE